MSGEVTFGDVFKYIYRVMMIPIYIDIITGLDDEEANARLELFLENHFQVDLKSDYYTITTRMRLPRKKGDKYEYIS